MNEKHPDSPGDVPVEEALNEPTRESMDQLGRADLDEEADPDARETGDDSSTPGQNSDSLTQ